MWFPLPPPCQGFLSRRARAKRGTATTGEQIHGSGLRGHCAGDLWSRDHCVGTRLGPAEPEGVTERVVTRGGVGDLHSAVQGKLQVGSPGQGQKLVLLDCHWEVKG